jgi:hypothetical protein
MERLLEPLRDDPLPPSAVDLERALTDGRRRVRYQRLATVVAACCAVLATAGVAVALDRPAAQERVDVASAPMPEQAPATFDPLRRYAAFGWLPDAVTDVRTKTGLDGMLVSASKQDTGRKGAESRVELRVVTAGHDIAVATPEDFVAAPGVTPGGKDMRPTEPVNGRPAHWNGQLADGDGAAALRWEYAPGAWAEVIVGGRAAGADPRATARRIASSVRYGVDEPVRLPFTVAGGLPAGLRPMAVSVSTSTESGSSPWGVQVEYGDGKRTPYGDWPLVVNVLQRSSRIGDGSVIGNPDTVIDGYPARRSSLLDGGKGLQVYDVQGLYVELATHDPVTTSQLPGGPDGLFRAMKLYRDQREWK